MENKASLTSLSKEDLFAKTRQFFDKSARLVSAAVIGLQGGALISNLINSNPESTVSQNIPALVQEFEGAQLDPKTFTTSCYPGNPNNWNGRGECIFPAYMLTGELGTSFYYNPEAGLQIIPNIKGSLMGMCKEGECIMKVRNPQTKQSFYVICPMDKYGFLAETFAGYNCKAIKVYQHDQQKPVFKNKASFQINDRDSRAVNWENIAARRKAKRANRVKSY